MTELEILYEREAHADRLGRIRLEKLYTDEKEFVSISRRWVKRERKHTMLPSGTPGIR
jgi:hypothetical protein